MKFIYPLSFLIAFSYLLSGCVVATDPINPTPVNPTLPANVTFVPANIKSLRIKNANVTIRKGTTTGYYITRGLNIDAINEYRQYVKINGDTFEYEPMTSGYLSTPTITLIMSNLSNIYVYDFGKITVNDEFTVTDLQITTRQNSDIKFKGNITANSFSFVGRDFGDLTMENLEVRGLTKIDMSDNVDFNINGNLISENVNSINSQFGDIRIRKDLLVSRELKVNFSDNVDLFVTGDIKTNSFVPVFNNFGSLYAENFTVEQNFTLNMNDNTNFIIKSTLTTSRGFVANLRNFAEVTATTLNNPQNIVMDMKDNSDFKITNINVANLTATMQNFAEIVATNFTAQKIIVDMQSNTDFRVTNIKANEMSYKLNDFADLIMSNLDNVNLTKVVFADNATVSLKGRTTTLDIETTASKETDLYLLAAENVIARHYTNSGFTSHLKVSASRSIDATISNKWNVYYKGNPTNVRTNYTSTGRLIKVN